MSLTDVLELNKTELFAKIRNGLPIVPQTQNLLDCKDDLLYGWDSNESCLLVTNWRVALLETQQERAKVSFQTLIPSNTVGLHVDRVLVSHEGSLVALSGPHGVAILEVPRRSGPDGNFMDGKPRITCRTYSLDAQLFQNNPQLEVRQLRWHPDSVSDSTLLVLLSNNIIRVYNHTKLRHVWKVGPYTAKVNHANSSLSDFGEISVDFDIAPPVKTTRGAEGSNDISSSGLNQSNKTLMAAKAKKEKVEWPILILRQNGNIYVMQAGIDSEVTRLQGPITISPQTSANYGLESCALLIIPSLPPTVVIAESTGKLHHALLLEVETTELSFNEVDECLLIEPSEWTLHVTETVELELGLSTGSEERYNCSIHLKRDLINEMRYFAYHNAGLHIVTINFIAELQRFLDSEAEDNQLALSTPSSAEYILCTKFDSSDRINAIFGIALLQMPAGLVLLLSSGQVISLKLVIDAQLLITPKDQLLRTTTALEQQQRMAPSFVDTIKALLQRSVSQPILADKLASSSAHERYELLNQAIEVLRSQYLKRHELVRAEFAKRINCIKLQRQQQLEEIKGLEQDREVISERAHKLAERFEEISDNQDILVRRCQKLMQEANTTLPNNVVAEREFAVAVARINKDTKSLAADLDTAKKTLNKQRYHIAKSQENGKTKTYELPEKQQRTVTEILTQLSTEIDRQIKDVKRINKILGT